MAAAIRQGAGTVTIRLHPASLGQVKIRIEQGKGAGQLSARFEVSRPEARELLDRTLAGLREALGARGVGVDRLDVELVKESPTGSGSGESGAATAGTPRAEHQTDQAPADAGASGGPGGGTAADQGSRGQDGRAMQDAWRAAGFTSNPSGADARGDGIDDGLEEVVGWPGGSAGVYRIADGDGGAGRVVVDAIA
jgi:hypothetical protein